MRQLDDVGGFQIRQVVGFAEEGEQRVELAAQVLVLAVNGTEFLDHSFGEFIDGIGQQVIVGCLGVALRGGLWRVVMPIRSSVAHAKRI